MMYFFQISPIYFRNFLIFRRNYHDKSENKVSIKNFFYKVSIFKVGPFFEFLTFLKKSWTEINTLTKLNKLSIKTTRDRNFPNKPI